MSKYPRICRVDPKPRSQGVFCAVCGEPAQFKSHIEVSWFRGEDEVRWSCKKHMRDAAAHGAALERHRDKAMGCL